MSIIGVLGYSEKIDLVSSLAKTLQLLKKAVLVIDGTKEKKYKYVIPAIETMDKAYLTQYDMVDYAVGFDSINDVENYLCENKINISLYDYIIVDIDSEYTYEFFRNKTFDKTYLVLDTSLLSYKKNLELLDAMRIYNTDENRRPMTKIMYRGYQTRAVNKYFENQYNNLGMDFDENEFEIFEDEQDIMLFEDSLLSGYMQLKKHSRMFINSIAEMAKENVEDIDVYTIRRAIKKGGI